MSQSELDVRPFEAIPAELVRRMRPMAGAAADELLADVPAGERDEVRAGIVQGLEHFYDLVEHPRTAWRRIAAAHRELGREMAVKGRDLEGVHRALRRSARATWRTLTSLAESLEVDRRTLGLIADAQFGYMDAVASQAALGHETETAGSAAAVRLGRARLLHLLLDAPPTSEELADAARDARWTVPRTVASVVLAPREDGTDRPPGLPPDVLVDRRRDDPCLIVPDPDGPGRARLLESLLRDWIVVIGPTVPPYRASESLRWAREGMALARRGRLDAGDLVRCMDHVPALVIFMAEDLIAHAADSRLAPLRSLRPVQAERLSDTLLSLLEHNFNATEAGSRLHVHPQTVRYRLRHLEELFGADLQDPGRCMELAMILYARRGARPGGLVSRVTRVPLNPWSEAEDRRDRAPVRS